MQTVLAAYELKAKGMYVLMKMVYFQCLPFDFMMLIFFLLKSTVNQAMHMPRIRQKTKEIEVKTGAGTDSRWWEGQGPNLLLDTNWRTQEKFACKWVRTDCFYTKYINIDGDLFSTHCRLFSRLRRYKIGRELTLQVQFGCAMYIVVARRSTENGWTLEATNIAIINS